MSYSKRLKKNHFVRGEEKIRDQKKKRAGVTAIEKANEAIVKVDATEDSIGESGAEGHLVVKGEKNRR